ncbi:toll/interleukin-1 receptor domain-containing protein [Streptomyces sp. NBC_01176]|uniref:toll/interleukin-1 receptor domain-containing protein n=1 Tax=Streptomyces sp. NBC_01176 TaxID=2903760 RepID=UPI002F91149A|nr:toll/interleukin-1 receptor domain-containing protein [Streptomyces sp. NBC_01176]
MKVFISHSSKGDRKATRLCSLLSAQLRECGHEVLIDRDGLKPGAEWRTELYRWLATCDAAVLVLSAKALASRWVQREIDILMWRRGLGCHLEVVPVLTEGLKTAATDAAGLTDLKTLEMVRGSTRTSARQMADQVIERFPDVSSSDRREDPMTAWLGRISWHLVEIRSAEVMRNAATALGMREEDAAQAALPAGGGAFMASHLLDSELSGRLCPAVGVLSDALSRDRLERLVKDVRPAWVEVATARELLPRSGTTRRTLLLNAEWPETAEDYIHRATCRPTYGAMDERLGAIPLDESASALPEAMTEKLLELYGCPPSTSLSRIRPDGLLYYLIFDVHQLTLTTALRCLETAHDLLPDLIVVVLTGPRLPDVVPPSRDDLHALPALAEDVEFEAYRNRQHLAKIVKRATG